MKSPSSSPTHRLGRPPTTPPSKQSRGGTSTVTQKQRERGRDFPSACHPDARAGFPAAPTQTLNAMKWGGGIKQTCRIYLKRSGEHVSKPPSRLGSAVPLSLPLSPFCYHSLETWEARQALPSERRRSPPTHTWTFTHAEWETRRQRPHSLRACLGLRRDFLFANTRADGRVLTARAGRSGDGRSLALAWTDLRAVESPREQVNWIDEWLHNGAAWTHVLILSYSALRRSLDQNLHDSDCTVWAQMMGKSQLYELKT